MSASRISQIAAAAWLGASGLAILADRAVAADPPVEGSPPTSLTKQLLDPDATPLRDPSQTGPRSLRPPTTVDALSPVPSFSPSAPYIFPGGKASPSQAVTPAQDLAARPGEEGTGIEVGRLSGLAAEGIGTLDGQTGGLPASLWQGSNRLHVEDALVALPDAGPSPAAASLLRRVLLSRGDMPQGASSGRPIVALRVEKLYAAGFAGEAAALASLVPAGEREGRLAAGLARAELALGHTEKACEALQHLPADGDPSTDENARLSLELSALCQAYNGQEVAALLSVDLAREQGVSDAGFIALATRAAGGPALDVPKDGPFTSLHYALARQGGTPLPADVVDRAEIALLPVLASEKELGWEQRLRAAELSAGLGLLNARDLADIYHRAEVEKSAGSSERAKAFAATLAETDPGRRLTLVNHAFVQTPVELWPGTLPVFSASLRAATPSVAQADHAVFMAEALALIGDPMRADAWVAIAATSRPEAVTRLETLLRVADSRYAMAWDPALAERAVAVRLAEGDDKAAGLLATEMHVLAGLGFIVPDTVWGPLYEHEVSGRAISDVTLRQLGAAGANRRMGEAALLALIAFDGQGPQTLSPSALGAVVSALRHAGLEDDARQIATEALVVRAHGG